MSKSVNNGLLAMVLLTAVCVPTYVVGKAYIDYGSKNCADKATQMYAHAKADDKAWIANHDMLTGPSCRVVVDAAIALGYFQAKAFK